MIRQSLLALLASVGICAATLGAMYFYTVLLFGPLVELTWAQ